VTRREYARDFALVLANRQRPAGWYLRLHPSAGEAQELGPLLPDRYGRAWIELPAPFVAWLDGQIGEFRVQWRIAGLEVGPGPLEQPRIVGVRLIGREDPTHWLYCHDDRVMLRPHDDELLLRAHERAHRAERRGRRSVQKARIAEIIDTTAESFDTATRLSVAQTLGRANSDSGEPTSHFKEDVRAAGGWEEIKRQARARART